ncbi:hypothetical protein ACTQ5J_10060 [Fundicoccus sp. Sow4_F4]|uniref:hypothetical protein n=1 Tax=Fundicoccus sp. Sow4_F4 TaxID=3438783 RepID=UPI003F8EE43C
MSIKVIDYIKDIEVQIEYSRREFEETIQFIENNLRKEIDELQRVYQADLNDYTEMKTSELEARLALEEEQLTQEFSQKKAALEAQFDQHKDQIVDRILKEVLNQYGYRQNEETDTLS